jgi:ABC-type transport system substrate-binding protein
MFLNASRPLFSSPRMRQAFNFAIDRTALASTCSPACQPTDHYIPPGIAGYRTEHVYPFHPNLKRARHLAGPGRHGAAIVWAAVTPSLKQRAKIVEQALSAIGIHAQIKYFPTVNAYYGGVSNPDAGFDVGVCCGWTIDYDDPVGVLIAFDGRLPFNQIGDYSHFNSSTFNTRFDAANRLTGAARDRAFGQLDVYLARNYAPVAAWGVATQGELFSQRIGCQIYQPISYGTDTDLAALCIRH